MSPLTRFCAYSWDLADDPAAADRALAAGVSGVAIAAAYHSVRAATPLHPRHRVVDAATAAFYLPVRPEAWGRLVPRSAAPWAGEDAFERAAATARRAGLDVEAWVVLMHSSVLGTAHPELCVRSAAGDVYPYALCPSHEDVRAYAVSVVTETVLLGGVDTLMIEACGPLGLGHLGHHEKTAGADWTRVDEDLLSLCFCGACRASIRSHGGDPEALAATVLAAVGTEASRVEDALGEGATLLLEVRDRSRRQLTAEVTAAARAAGARRLLFHAQADPWATGPFAALLDTPGADGVVLPATDLALDGGVRPAVAPGVRVGGYLPVLPPVDPDAVPGWADLLRDLDDLYLYHLGLLSRRRLDAVGELVTRLRA
ncbi:hypothetical protein [Rathayibacter sp. Leaf296]|uniref:hypothetical protein n=1 Tax=Rathayibacter sp. Leaf296 TaxID=1736327 RepID=UPI00070283FD|nr:hypothetical protein [Rathayibacter sp. Leaf296]KQQ08545.1 hypothetical protein ASF46_14725 [Rathayibacter sp. Leaf296]